jgi:hypothetical protein
MASKCFCLRGSHSETNPCDKTPERSARVVCKTCWVNCYEEKEEHYD